VAGSVVFLQPGWQVPVETVSHHWSEGQLESSMHPLWAHLPIALLQKPVMHDPSVVQDQPIG
jgi:hypothetical protein